MIGGNASARRAEEFDAAVSGRATGESRERYAELLDVVGAMRTVPQPVARTEFVADLRSQLMAAAAEMPAPARVTDEATALRLTPRQRRGSRERRAAALLGGFAVVAASGSMALASQSALPGDTLYPVKRAIENAHANLETSPAAKASVLLDNANTRLSEVEALSSRGDGDSSEISSTLQAFKDQTSQASAIAIDGFASNGDPDALDAVHAFASSSMDRLTALDDVLPVGARPALVAAAQTVKTIDQAAYDACPTCADGGVTQLPSFATQPLSSSLRSALLAGTHQGTGTTGKGTHTTTTTPGDAKPSAGSSPDAGSTTAPPAGGVKLPTSLPTGSTSDGGLVSGTLNQLTKDLLGGTSASSSTPSTTKTSKGTDASTGTVIGGLTGLLGLGG